MKVCSPSGSASLTITANSAVDGDVETITCTGSVEGELNMGLQKLP